MRPEPLVAAAAPVSRPTDDRGPLTVALIWSMVVFASVFLAMRLYCKVARQNGLWWDDHLLIAAFVCFTTPLQIIDVELTLLDFDCDSSGMPNSLRSPWLGQTLMDCDAGGQSMDRSPRKHIVDFRHISLDLEQDVLRCNSPSSGGLDPCQSDVMVYYRQHEYLVCCQYHLRLVPLYSST
jgi:hypothetical protein